MRRYGIAEFQSVMALIESGLSDSEIAQRTGVGRRSMNGWRHGRGVSYHLRVSRATPAWRPREPAAYAYEYPRYFFSNLSEDIRDIFYEHCDMLGLRWTQASARNISVANRAGVATLDQFVGPKR
jgi:hypothetical protein